MEKNTFFIFSGLPGVGKTTLSKSLSAYIGATYLRIDTIEQALRELCACKVHSEGYRMAYRLVKENLLLGQSVVADSCNPITLTRREWEQVAVSAGVDYVNIEVICSDVMEHRARVENRKSSINGLALPPWEQVQNREYDTWDRHRISLDTAGQTREESFAELLSAVSHH